MLNSFVAVSLTLLICAVVEINYQLKHFSTIFKYLYL